MPSRKASPKPAPQPDTPPVVGRPRKTEIDADVQGKIVEAIKTGSTYELAALRGGISYATFHNWMKRGEAEEAPYVDFFKAIKEAEGEGAYTLLQKINTAANESWQAAAWILERRYPEMYGRQRVELTGKEGGAIIIKTGMNMDEL